ncbi:MAG TPA: MXAN_5187 family protein [Anaeromyxobacteraceae bacterium]|nr:MXAN_5187 family protein [Anaeromyxobacteraceae bacterium]
MNRIKFWLYAALVLGAGAAHLVSVSRSLAQNSLAQIDQELGAAAAQIDARQQILGGEATRWAEAIARDPTVAQALSPTGEGDPAVAAQTAARAVGADSSGSILLVTWGRGGRAFRANGASVPLDDRVEGFASIAASEMTRREGYGFAGDSLYYVVAVPAMKGSSVAVGVPIDLPWLSLAHRAIGADVSLLVDGHAPLSTLPRREAPLVAAAARGAKGKTVDAGKLSRQQVAIQAPDSPPLMPLLFSRVPAYRVESLALKGFSGATLALSLPAAPSLRPALSYAWSTAIALTILALIGVVVGLLVMDDQGPMIPRDLAAAADRMARGDFTARAPLLAGALGTISSALNRAAGAAEAAAAPPHEEAYSLSLGSAAIPAATSSVSSPHKEEAPAELPPAESSMQTSSLDLTSAEKALEALGMGAEKEEPQPSLSGVFPFSPASSEEPESGKEETAEAGPESGPGPLFGGIAPAGVQVRADRSQDNAFGEAQPPLPEPPLARTEPAEMRSAPLPQRSATVVDDEEHWQAAYKEFLKVRGECGEPLEGLPYDRFRLKLQKSREQLIAKYACRTVRFQVYVKEGRAALKASPVR